MTRAEADDNRIRREVRHCVDGIAESKKNAEVIEAFLRKRIKEVQDECPHRGRHYTPTAVECEVCGLVTSTTEKQ